MAKSIAGMVGEWFTGPNPVNLEQLAALIDRRMERFAASRLSAPTEDAVEAVAREPWIQTYSGKKFFPSAPKTEDVDILDIAHALSMLCRYGGHCKQFYSVAEHSVHASYAVASEHALWALLHDASEAYLVDVPRPIKPLLTGYKELEAGIMRAVCGRFGLPNDQPEDVARVDKALLYDERVANMAIAPEAWSTDAPPVGAKLLFLSPPDAEAAFLARFNELCPQHARAAIAALPTPPGGGEAMREAAGWAFQPRVHEWIIACFGAEIGADKVERNHRFLEEALEAVQSLGCTASEAHQLVDYVYGRPVGDPRQEVGGVLNTLAALCTAAGIDMVECGEAELRRVWTKVEQIRAKQAAKPKHSPLPGPSLPTPPQEG